LGAEAAVTSLPEDLRYSDEAVPPADARWLSPLPLWIGILAGPVAWAFDLTVSYALVKWTCLSQREALLHAMTIVALVIIGGGAALSFFALQTTAGDQPEDGGRPRQRARFMAILGLTSCALFALTVIAGAIPRWVLDACQ
jgi:hypothetical protein